MGGAVKLISSVEDWQAALTQSKGFGGKAFIIDFTASWCGSCQRIAPMYEQLSREFPGVTFYKCDVDEVQEVASECGVRAMPTFVGYFNGEKVGECLGADIKKIKELITLLNNKSGAVREAAEAQKALAAALSSVTEDLLQRVAGAAAAASTAAIKAAIGPAVRAAVEEALPAALSADATTAGLERALAGQIAAALPKAVRDGLGGAFATKVVPPLELASASAFAQMDATLRSGLEAHLAPLGAHIKEALAQVLESEVSGVPQSAATTSRAATALTAVLAAAQQQAAAAATPSPSAATGPLAPEAERQQQRELGGDMAAAAGGKGAQATAADPTEAAAAAAAMVADPAEATAAAAPAAAAAQPSTISSMASAASPPAAAGPPPPRPPAGADPALLEAITDLISAGDVDTAMGRVLERTDLALVVWACGALGGPGLLAREPCPLSQPTLLSLLTFLECDLTSDVDLKLAWIDAILKCLDVEEPGLAQHLKTVLVSVKGKLVDIARGSTGATAAKAKQAAHQAIALIAMTS